VQEARRRSPGWSLARACGTHVETIAATQIHLVHIAATLCSLFNRLVAKGFRAAGCQPACGPPDRIESPLRLHTIRAESLRQNTGYEAGFPRKLRPRFPADVLWTGRRFLDYE
jgi:hypothetical protein